MTRGMVAAVSLGGLLLLGMAPGTARAATREDVLASAIRCGGLAQDRQWLDCYYGAAQPMRATLHLAPAPASQLDLLRSAPQGGTIGGVRQDVLSLAIGCSGIAQDRPWLDCYYGAAQPMRAHLGLSPAPQARQTLQPLAPARPARAVMASASPPVPTSQPARMPASPGLFEGLFGGKSPLVEKSRIASFSIGREGYFTATLANGEVWRQVSGTSDARWTHDSSQRDVVIRRGVLRSFNFRVSGDPTLYKVERVR